MRIKVLEETGIRHEGLQLSHEDEVTVDDVLGGLFCDLGWAEDLGGNVKTGERDTRPKTIDPQRLTSSLHTEG